jgi:hypothetical protein
MTSTRNTTDHTACYEYGLHAVSAAGRAWCRKHPVRRQWMLIDGAAKEGMKWHAATGAAENAAQTLSDEGMDWDAIMDDDRYYQYCIGSYDSLIDLYTTEGTFDN